MARTAGQSTRLKKAFLAHFAEYGNVTQAARAVGIERKTVYIWQEIDEQFLLAFREGEIKATEHLEAEARRRAVEGVDKQRRVYDNRGNLIDEYTETSYSDTLLIFLLKARNPTKYRDNARVEVTGKDGGPIDVDADPREHLANRVAELITRARALGLAGESNPD